MHEKLHIKKGQLSEEQKLPLRMSQLPLQCNDNQEQAKCTIWGALKIATLFLQEMDMNMNQVEYAASL